MDIVKELISEAEKNIEKANEGLFETHMLEVSHQVDAYCGAAAELEAHMEKLKPLQDFVADLKKELLSVADAQPADEKAILVGEEYELELGPKANQVIETDKEELLETLGEENFYELAQVKIGDIRKYCTPPQIAQILTEARVGSRKINVKKKLKT